MRRALAILAVVLPGCAFSNVNMVMPAGGLESPVRGGNGREVVVVIPFADERAIRDRCGMQKNSYNMDTADAVCTSDPSAWLANLLAQELRTAGFSVADAGSSHGEDALRVEGSLLKVFVEPVIGFWSGSHEADLQVKLVATSATGLRAERIFFTKARQGGAFISITPLYELTLRKATREILGDMVRSVVALMDRYPELGSRPPDAGARVAGAAETRR
jgi:hypothetical protein